MSDYDRMWAVATDAERIVLETIAARAGITTESGPEIEEVRVVDNRAIHRPDCDCAGCLVGESRRAESWEAYQNA